jgi:uncharacterized damage-inducible protein DinB
MKNMLCIIFLTALILPVSIFAQVVTGQLVKEWERAKKFTQDYLDAMPEDGYELKPTKEMRSFAEQMLHLAAGNYGLGAAVLGIKSPVTFEEVEKSTDHSKAGTDKIALASYDFVINGLKALSDDKLKDSVKVFDNSFPRDIALFKTYEHQTHHRGQTTVYLRLKGITPPRERLFQ